MLKIHHISSKCLSRRNNTYYYNVTCINCIKKLIKEFRYIKGDIVNIIVNNLEENLRKEII